MVVGIAIALFVVAAFAGPSEPPGPQGKPATAPSAAASPTERPTGSPVADIDEILAEEVSGYLLVDRGVSEGAAQGGALDSAELRYALDREGGDTDTDIFHTIEVHVDQPAASARVSTYGEALTRTGFRVVREQPLRSSEDEVQGTFIALRATGQHLLLWSNRNTVFSLGGGPDADVEAFYDALPY